MKPIKSIIVLTLIIWFTQTGCKKDKTNFFLKGTIKHKYTKEPIPGLEIEISEVRPGFLGSNRTVWDRTTTNSEGEFSLKLQKTDIDYGYNVYTILPFSIDTNKLQHKFIQSNSYLTSIELRKKLTLELEPSGYISTYITNSTWDSLPADTVIISSPYSTNQLIRGQDRIYFYVDPVQYNQFSWYYRKNGINGPTVTKQIYVPNYYREDRSAYVLFYEITFP